ncbi:hypothetical protein [Treponema brennaborense]|uniref:Peptidase C14 caspase catalytic subunit p20 n=1 Tax=Treponema brennaborense (strain DSM 12168 / CIP 105900 / DD5/3) TaxID=906968 RepID=F4LIY0_TREBD|nr:hypothetical protein [Treponema brennaborense]AEE17289.1 hypothetical protein Trebr_1869 [Treponema brennaborense DSM 12168]
MTRYAILAGSSAQAGFQQKSLCNIYDFLKSTAGGFWFDREILILPEGVSVPLLKFILRRVAESGTDFLFLYFCGNQADERTRGGFTVGGTEIKYNYIEEICPHQITVFDACAALIPMDDDCAAECTADFADKRQSAAARILSDEAFCSLNGGLRLNGCGDGAQPVLGADGSGVYTAALVEALCSADTLLDFTAADRNARFACAVAREIGNHTTQPAGSEKSGGVSSKIKPARCRKSESVRI